MSMKKFAVILLFILAGYTSYGQIIKGAGILYFDTLPNIAATLPYGSEVAFSIYKKSLYVWDRDSSRWDIHRDTIFEINTLQDTATLIPTQGDWLINGTADTIGVYSGSHWITFAGGSSTWLQPELQAGDVPIDGFGNNLIFTNLGNFNVTADGIVQINKQDTLGYLLITAPDDQVRVEAKDIQISADTLINITTDTGDINIDAFVGDLYLDASDDVVISEGVVTIDKPTSRVGLNVSSPQYTLDILNGGLRLGGQSSPPAGAAGVLYQNSTSNWIYHHNGTAFGILTENAATTNSQYEVAYFDANGRIQTNNLNYNGSVLFTSTSAVGMNIANSSKEKIFLKLHNGANAGYVVFEAGDGSPDYAYVGTRIPGYNTSTISDTEGGIAVHRHVTTMDLGSTLWVGSRLGTSGVAAGHTYYTSGSGTNADNGGNAYLRGSDMTSQSSGAAGKTGLVYIQTYRDSSDAGIVVGTSTFLEDQMIFSGQGNRTTARMPALYSEEALDYYLVLDQDTVKKQDASFILLNPRSVAPASGEGNLYKDSDDEYFYGHDGATHRALAYVDEIFVPGYGELYTEVAIGTGDTITLSGGQTKTLIFESQGISENVAITDSTLVPDRTGNYHVTGAFTYAYTGPVLPSGSCANVQFEIWVDDSFQADGSANGAHKYVADANAYYPAAIDKRLSLNSGDVVKCRVTGGCADNQIFILRATFGLTWLGP